MLIRNKIARDTLMLTIMQLILDTAALALNGFITRKIGASAMGMFSLTGSFLMLAGVLSNGNAYLCTSRLVSEETGRKNGNPDRVLLSGIIFCTGLCAGVSAMLFVFSDMIGTGFFHSPNMSIAVRKIPLALVPAAYSSCLKGYFNACRKSSVTAAADILDFAAKSSATAFMILTAKDFSDGKICGIMISGSAAGSLVSLVFMLAVFVLKSQKYSGKASVGFRKYAASAFPIMGGGIITSVLSSTNDALIPVTLRQYGDSVSEAFSRFGVFEAIVIPTLFFPSVVLCSMSGIIVSESARAMSAGNNLRLKHLAERLISGTLIFAVFASAVLIRFGNEIGELLGGGEQAGKMISMIAPVVPFIYLEIVLEAMIKGMGMQGFSSLNYLGEYAVRISVVLIFVPRIGFYGIAASYYASNILGNVLRLAKILKSTGVRLKPVRNIILPIVFAFMTMKAAELASGMIFSGNAGMILRVSAEIILWAAAYSAFFLLLNVENSRNLIFSCEKYTKEMPLCNIKCRKLR